MKIKRILTNICCDNLEKSKIFYSSLFDFNVDYDSDWFVHLISEGRELEIGLIRKNHEIVPPEVSGTHAGYYVTFVVEDVEETHLKAQALDCEILQSPEVTFYGQKRMLIKTPEGTVLDVSSPM